MFAHSQSSVLLKVQNLFQTFFKWEKVFNCCHCFSRHSTQFYNPNHFTTRSFEFTENLIILAQIGNILCKFFSVFMTSIYSRKFPRDARMRFWQSWRSSCSQNATKLPEVVCLQTDRFPQRDARYNRRHFCWSCWFFRHMFKNFGSISNW